MGQPSERSGALARRSPEPQICGGVLAARRLKAHGVERVFTLSGGHVFDIYDGCRAEGIGIVDVRHEQTAAFAAEGWAKVTRQPGVAVLTAGPGVTNAMSAIASAAKNHSPMLALAGRAPAARWGQGSLQELDHVAFVAPLTKFAATSGCAAEIPVLVDRALRIASTPHGGPTFVDCPLDHLHDHAEAGAVDLHRPDRSPAADGAAFQRAATLLRGARRPVVMAGTDLYWDRAEEELRAFAHELRIPVFLNGLARGCVPADDELCLRHARREALRGADVAFLVGAPMDFRLGFGRAFGKQTSVVVVDRAPAEHEHPRAPAAELYGSIGASLRALRDEAPAAGTRAARDAWIEGLRASERAMAAELRAEGTDDRSPLHPLRVYAELGALLDRDAIVIGDGGDFVSFAGRVVDSHQPGCWLDPGPFGCLGAGPGYALAAKIAHPQRQVVLLLGDGAFGFSGLEYDTFVRHRCNVVGVMGNNGIWGLEKHPMERIYGYSVAADLRPGTRYDQVVEALGGHGELVSNPRELTPALVRAFESGKPALVNVLTDPAVAYPRRSNLA